MARGMSLICIILYLFSFTCVSCLIFHFYLCLSFSFFCLSFPHLFFLPFFSTILPNLITPHHPTFLASTFHRSFFRSFLPSFLLSFLLSFLPSLAKYPFPSILNLISHPPFHHTTPHHTHTHTQHIVCSHQIIFLAFTYTPSRLLRIRS